MSVRVTSWAWDQHVGDDKAKLVLLKLADQANDDGICWPSRRTIAGACETSLSSVSRCTARLAELGLIKIEPRARPADGGQSSNEYHFTHLTPPCQADKGGGQSSDKGGGQSSDKGGGQSSDKGPLSTVTSHEPSVE